MKFKQDTIFDAEHLDELFAIWEKITQGVKLPFIIEEQ